MNTINVEGLYTHFAAGKDLEDTGVTAKQVEIFKTWIESFEKAGFKPIIHAAASGATFLFPQTYFDMVRVGISLHGLWPAEETRQHLAKKYTLKPTLSWKTIISEIKIIPK